MLLVEELCEKLGIQRSTVWKWCRQKKVPHIRIGKRYYFDEKELEKWIKDKRG
jgi:excisionase family DNA binding protein